MLHLPTSGSLRLPEEVKPKKMAHAPLREPQPFTAPGPKPTGAFFSLSEVQFSSHICFHDSLLLS